MDNGLMSLLAVPQQLLGSWESHECELADLGKLVCQSSYTTRPITGDTNGG